MELIPGGWMRSLARPFRRRLALVMCLRNEARFLGAHLLYHHAVGVDRAYVFLDRCSDESEAIARSFPWVRVFVVDPQESARFDYVADLHAACMNRALKLARADGFEWLMVLDPDEFAFADNATDGSAIARAHLDGLLDRAQTGTVMIRLRTHEVVPARLPAEAPFWAQHFFQAEPRLTWKFPDPLGGPLLAWPEFLGHRQGKTIVRTSGEVQAYDSHRWVPEQGLRFPDRPEHVPLPAEDLGGHWHYYVVDHRHWLDKFKKLAHEPEVWICGTAVEAPKQSFKRAANRMTAEEARAYFDLWLARSEEELRAYVAQGLVTETDAVAAVLREAKGEARPRPTELFHPISDSDLQRSAGPRYRYPIAHVRELLQGFHCLERDGDSLFRWTLPAASLRLQLPPANYELVLHMGRLGSLWNQRLQLAINGQPVPARARSCRQGQLRQVLLRSDFPAADEHRLQLGFDPLDTSSWPVPDPRTLGAPLFQIDFEPLADRSVRRHAARGSVGESV